MRDDQLKASLIREMQAKMAGRWARTGSDSPDPRVAINYAIEAMFEVVAEHLAKQTTNR